MSTINWTKGPEGITASVNGCNLRVNRLDERRYVYFVHRPGDANQNRGEEKTLEGAKASAELLAQR